MHSAVLTRLPHLDAPIDLRITNKRTHTDPVPRRLRHGQPLFHERDAAKYIYEIVSGAVRLSRMQKDGRRQVIAFGFPGDIVGLPADDRHTTECEAITDCEIIAHRCSSLSEPCRNPDLHQVLMQAALNEVRALQDHFLMLGRRLALEKTAAFLALLLDRMSERLGAYSMIRLPMNRSDIADYLGLTPETVSRAFTELRGRRILALDDANTVIVLDAVALKALADGSDAE